MIVDSNIFKKKPKKYINFYKKHGYLLIKNSLSKILFKNIQKSITSNLYKYTKKKNYLPLDSLELNKHLKSLRKKSPKKFSYFFDTLQTSIALNNFWTNDGIIKIIEVLMGCEKSNISATDLLLRIDSPIDDRNKLDWHQDSAYFKQNKSGYNGVNCWASLTNLTLEMGPLEFLENSHKLGCIKVKKSRDLNYSSLQRKISTKITDKFKIKSFKMSRGDLLVMNMDLIHRSGANYSKKFRMSAICRYHNMASKDFEPGLNIYRYSNKKVNKKVHGF